jgi:hypothetical protein
VRDIGRDLEITTGAAQIADENPRSKSPSPMLEVMLRNSGDIKADVNKMIGR